MKLVMIKIIFEVLLVPNKRVFRIQVNYVISYHVNRTLGQLRLASLKHSCNIQFNQQCKPITSYFYNRLRATNPMAVTDPHRPTDQEEPTTEILTRVSEISEIF